MRYTAMGRSPRNDVSVPALSGGVNLGDALNLVDDNQLTDCKNVWYKDGILQTRPGIRHLKAFDEEETLLNEELEVYSTDVVGFLDGIKYSVVIKKKKETSLLIDGTYETVITYAEIIVLGENGKEFSVAFESFVEDSSLVFWGKPVLDDGIGLFILQTYKPFDLRLSQLIEVCKIGNSYSCQTFTPFDYYSPHILINGKGDSYSSLPTDTTTNYAPASMFEGHSLFYEAIEKYCFVTDGKSTTFTIPTDLYMSMVRVSYIDPNTGKEHSTNWLNKVDETGEVSESLGTTGYTVKTNGKSNVFEIKKSDNAALPSSLGKIANNLTFSVQYHYYPTVNQGDSNYEKQSSWIKQNRSESNFVGMDCACWFGGSASGIGGGTRLFLTGGEENKSLLLWSDLNNPTYFPENNYAYIGSSSQRITALAKQDDMLVIFKENEIFYTTYVEGATYTAEDVISGKVIDVTTLSATFPIIQIHSEIGCDLPSSIQLCGNRLVWACKDGHVYSLKSANQYSTANVAKLSALIDKRISAVTSEDFNNAFSGIYNGHYLLMLGKHVFVLDFDHYYFNSLPSYSDTQKAQRKLVWYYWEFPIMQDSIFIKFFSNNNHCYIFNVSTFYIATGAPQTAQYNMFELVEERLEDDCLKQTSVINSGDGVSLDVVTVPIESVIQTKMFDFGAMERFKSIEQLYIGFGKAEGETALQYITENGTLDKGTVNIEASSDIHSPQYVETKRFLPCIKRALRFGLRITTKGRIALGGILIKFKYMGVTR